MSASKTAWDIAREWAIFGAAGCSALFAGLIWALARKKLANKYVLRAGSIRNRNQLSLEVEVTNRGDHELMIEEISAVGDIQLLVTASGWAMSSNDANRPDYQPLRLTKRTDFNWTIQPDHSEGRRIVVERNAGFEGVRKVSIRLHILKSFPVIRHSKKVLTAILPANIRKDQK